MYIVQYTGCSTQAHDFMKYMIIREDRLIELTQK